MANLLKLAERCERLQGPSLDCNHDIYEALGAIRPVYPGMYWTSPGATTKHYDALVPHYTHEMDAAMLLRPAGWSWQLKTAEHHENGYQFECWVSWGPSAYHRISAQAPTPALAICAGWFRARHRDPVSSQKEPS